MSFIFYDLEASGLAPAWNVPLQAAFVATSADCLPSHQTVLTARLPAHVVPSPDAMLVTGLDPDRVDAAPLSQLEMMKAIAGILDAASPTTILGYNQLAYDEEVLRHGFLQTLHPPYGTSMPGFARADVLIMLRTVAMLAPDAITIPVTPQGKPTMRLGPVCRANGIAFDEADAHDALNDVHATIALFRLLRERAPAVIAAMMINAHKSGPTGLLARPEPLGLGLFNRMTPIGGIMQVPNNASSWAVADLTVDPTYLDATPEQLGEMLFARGERSIRLVKTNAQPILLPWEMATTAGQSEIPPDGEPPQRSRRSKVAIVVEALDLSERDAELDVLAARMATATPAGRSALVEMAARLHTANERREMRTRVLRHLRKVHYDDLPARQAARRIAAALAHRQGEHIRSTGSIGKDQLYDRIVLTGLATSAETIRQSL